MPVKGSKNQVRCKSRKRWVFNWRRKVCNFDDEMTASGRPFQTWAAVTGKARLPAVDSLMGGATRRLVLADRRVRRPGRSATATRGPRYRGALSWSTLNVLAPRFCTVLHEFWYTQPVQCRPTHLWCGRVVAGGIDESCCRVELRLQTAHQVGWDTDQYCIAVVESRAHQSHYAHLERDSWRKVMAAYGRVDDLQSPAGWLPVHGDQPQAQRSVTSMGSLYLSFFSISVESTLTWAELLVRNIQNLAYLPLISCLRAKKFSASEGKPPETSLLTSTRGFAPWSL